MKLQNSKDSIIKTKEFIELWKKFNSIYKEAMGKSAITEEEEELFLETKSIVARKFQTLADSFSIDRHTIDKTYDVIGSILSLRSISTLSEPTLRKLESDWHEAYISLNRLLGHLEAHKEVASKDSVKNRSQFLGKSVGLVVVVLVFVMVILFLAQVLGVLK